MRPLESLLAMLLLVPWAIICYFLGRLIVTGASWAGARIRRRRGRFVRVRRATKAVPRDSTDFIVKLLTKEGPVLLRFRRRTGVRQ